jgi:hypothetical protein
MTNIFFLEVICRCSYQITEYASGHRLALWGKYIWFKFLALEEIVLEGVCFKGTNKS